MMYNNITITINILQVTHVGFWWTNQFQLYDKDGSWLDTWRMGSSLMAQIILCYKFLLHRLNICPSRTHLSTMVDLEDVDGSWLGTSNMGTPTSTMVDLEDIDSPWLGTWRMGSTLIHPDIWNKTCGLAGMGDNSLGNVHWIELNWSEMQGF